MSPGSESFAPQRIYRSRSVRSRQPSGPFVPIRARTSRPVSVVRAAPEHRRSCLPEPLPCRVDTASRGRSAAQCRRDTWSTPAPVDRDLDNLFGRQVHRTSTPDGALTECQFVEPLGLPAEHLVGHAFEGLATITNPPTSGSSAPRWMLDRNPARLPDPHSTASTTRSNVYTGFTLRHPCRADPPRTAG